MGGLGTRFRFGRNWRNYVDTVDGERIAEAERSLAILGDIEGKTFLDAGCGSGLFSLAATRLGANVTAFDYDPDSVAAARELQQRTGVSWPVERGDILDLDGRYDVVYSWGVIHHTGDMWRALDNLCRAVNRGGQLYVSVYNDQGRASKLWRTLKRLYVTVPPLRPLLVLYAFLREMWGYLSLTHPLRSFKAQQHRGMNRWHDLVDWAGGYPFEVATVGEVFDFCRERGLRLKWLNDAGAGHGCNEFLFTNASA